MRSFFFCPRGGARGTIEFASPRSRALLDRYFGVTNGAVFQAILTGTTVASGAEGV